MCLAASSAAFLDRRSAAARCSVCIRSGGPHHRDPVDPGISVHASCGQSPSRPLVQGIVGKCITAPVCESTTVVCVALEPALTSDVAVVVVPPVMDDVWVPWGTGLRGGELKGLMLPIAVRLALPSPGRGGTGSPASRRGLRRPSDEIEFECTSEPLLPIERPCEWEEGREEPEPYEEEPYCECEPAAVGESGLKPRGIECSEPCSELAPSRWSM